MARTFVNPAAHPHPNYMGVSCQSVAYRSSVVAKDKTVSEAYSNKSSGYEKWPSQFQLQNFRQLKIILACDNVR